MLVATAGHIDHGKTTLVRALTGVDTDRLPEEKARGISIDLGFAYWTCPAGQVLGFVDVPGHERFVRNMLAGVCGIDFALLVVAADDGVMPQTREHLQILDLLAVRSGLAVVTKCDRVGAERVAEVSAEVAALLAGTGLAQAPVLGVSAVQGDGIAPLQAALAAAAAQHRARAVAGRNLRFTIDRAFTVAGTGTVVTGTVLDGRVATGDKLVVSPSGVPVRVRAVHQQGRAAAEASAGERCALAITGADPQQAGRGQWLVAPEMHAPSQRLDARVRLLGTESQALRHWTEVHLHVGTAEVLAHVVMPGEALAPGGSGIAQLALEHPVAVAHGDRFILRDKSARRTLGGGTVIDPFATAPKRDRSARLARLQALEQPEAEAAFTALLDSTPGGVDVDAFQRRFNLAPSRVQALLDRPGVVTMRGQGTTAFSPPHLQGLTTRVLRALQDFHDATPHVPGMDVEALCKAAVPELELRIAQQLLRSLAERRALEVSGSLARLPSHATAIRPSDAKTWAVLEPLYRQWHFNVPQVNEIATRTGLKPAQLRDFFQHGVRVGHLVRLSPERFYLRSTVAELAQLAVDLAARSPAGRFGVADYRDFSGIGRNLSIEILECLDRLGVTLRAGNVRSILHADAVRGAGGGSR